MFSVRSDEPFIIFRELQEIARKAVGDADVIDLSRGDPGYGFTPSVRGREFASYVLFLDSVLNASADERFPSAAPGLSPGSGALSPSAAEFIPQRIADITNALYRPDVAKRLQHSLQEFIEKSLDAAREEGKQWRAADMLHELFSRSAMSGGSYLDPKGQELTRVVVAAWHRKEYALPITSADLILTRGASHAIGTVFKALGGEGCGYLRSGDRVSVSSPVYAPYNHIFAERGLCAVSHHERAKALILIDPNNPTGLSLPQERLNALASFARENDMLVITDEVYSSFFPRKRTMLALAPERTICINARSKIERSTGLRFGEIITTPGGRRHIAAMLGLGDADAFERLLIFSKSPGRTGGQFQHTTFVTGPSQLLGIAHIVLGDDEREAYLRSLHDNMRVFCEALTLPYEGNQYYILFSLDRLPHSRTRDLPVEERLVRLAEAGVIYLPACRFFAEEERDRPEVLASVRASVVNTTAERLREAARRTKGVSCS